MPTDPYQRLVGSTVIACEQVEDYLHIRLDVAVINIANPFQGLELSRKGCEGLLHQHLVGIHVKPVEFITFTFSGGTEIVVSLKPTDYVGPEAVEIHFPEGGAIVL